MCGRMNVIGDPLTAWVSKTLGISFQVSTNNDLRPTQQVEAVSLGSEGMQQISASWGIQPAWSKRLIINAQAETIAEKRTFANAFASRRCIVPCSGWYEWRAEGGPRKVKYLFSHAEEDPFYMAAIWYPRLDGDALPRIVTLTTEANQRCRDYHHRMPVLIPPEFIDTWLAAEPRELGFLLLPPDSGMVQVSM